VKIGDFVGWKDTWDDASGCEMVGLIVECSYDGEYFDVLLWDNGKIMIEVARESMVVMFENR
tara:strand:+ start:2036 stop:2221 length:186 start_codon:yes stop_codon:yes gene_type:complete